MKSIEAIKVKDGYLVRITEEVTARMKHEVYDIIRQNGLKIKLTSTGEKILAD